MQLGGFGGQFTKISKEGGRSQSFYLTFWGSGQGSGVEVLILIPKTIITLVNFRGGGGGSGSPDPPPPPPHYGFKTQKPSKSVETIDAPQIYGCSIRVAS